MGTINDYNFLHNAYFFKIKNERLPENAIKNLFDEIQRVSGIVHLRLENEDFDGVNFSFISFQLSNYPSCVEVRAADPSMKESRLAFLMMMEYNGYLCINKRNYPSLSSLKDAVEPVDYNVLKNVLLPEGDPVFQRFYMSNTDITSTAMRNKILEAPDLAKAFPSMGAGTYKLNSYRVKNGDSLVSVTLNKGKIGESGLSIKYRTLIHWIKELVDRIASYDENVERNNYLSIFAKPVKYSEIYQDLIPKSLLFQTDTLLNDEEIDRIFFKEKKGKERKMSPQEIYNFFSYSLKVEPTVEEFTYVVKKDNEEVAKIIMGARAPRIKSKYLDKIRITYEGNKISENSLLEYIIEKGLYVIHFSDREYKYSDRTLFKVASLLERRNEFLSILKPVKGMGSVTSEKGKFLETDEEFSKTCLFGLCEKTFNTDEGSIMVCDDLGTEWADHILIQDDGVKLFASKYKKAKFSASAFHDVVSQVLKNLGVFYNDGPKIEEKREKWNHCYKSNQKNNNVQTRIPRVRTKGKTAEDAIAKWKEATQNPNYRGEVWLLVNFLSRDTLEATLNSIASGNADQYEDEAMAILWLLHSLITACQNMNVGVRIGCKK